jgi:hypothetical protein
MPSRDRVMANRREHADEKARATAGRAAQGGAREKPAIPALTDVDCHGYRAGHNVHWMQALNSINKPEYARLTWTGRIVALDGLGFDVAQPDGTIVRYLNHHTERLIALSDGVGSNVSVNNHWAILRCGSYTFSISEDLGQPLDGCVTDRPSAAPTDEERAALIESHGGFSAPVQP